MRVLQGRPDSTQRGGPLNAPGCNRPKIYRYRERWFRDVLASQSKGNVRAALHALAANTAATVLLRGECEWPQQARQQCAACPVIEHEGGAPHLTSTAVQILSSAQTKGCRQRQRGIVVEVTIKHACTHACSLSVQSIRPPPPRYDPAWCQATRAPCTTTTRIGHCR